jgi:hypothetical protein
MEYGKPHAYREPMHPYENIQWCGEFPFAFAAVLIDRFLPQIPRRDRHVIADLMRALWKRNAMLMLSRLFE